MAIVGIETQPSSDGLSAAYRPIIYQVEATATNGDPIPPVVYCDIYFNSIFYKTISKTQYKEDLGGSSLWEFDIQDAAQEYLEKYLAPLYGDQISPAPPLISQVVCYFRSSGYDTDGFILPEGTIPIQATGDQAGTSPASGTASNLSYVVNSTLQHDQAQDLATHLASYFRDNDWAVSSGVYPLTHRPQNYFVCINDSDYFPIVSQIEPTNIQIDWENKDGSTGSSTSDPVCVPISIPSFTLPNAQTGQPYSAIIPLSGSAPFDLLGSPVAPSWMSIVIDGSTLVFSGTPTSGDAATHVQVSVSVENCGGDAAANFTKYIDVTTCVAVSWGSILFADAIAGVPYFKSIPLSGTPPFIIDGIGDLPSWMDVIISGSTIQFFGTPSDGDVGNDQPISIDLCNCSGTECPASLTATINVLTSNNFTLQGAYNFKINSASGAGIPAIGPTTVNGAVSGHQTGMSGDYTVNITGTTVTPCFVALYINGIFISCQTISASIGTSIFEVNYSFTGVTASESDQVKFTINSGICPP